MGRPKGSKNKKTMAKEINNPPVEPEVKNDPAPEPSKEPKKRRRRKKNEQLVDAIKADMAAEAKKKSKASADTLQSLLVEDKDPVQKIKITLWSNKNISVSNLSGRKHTLNEELRATVYDHDFRLLDIRASKDHIEIYVVPLKKSFEKISIVNLVGDLILNQESTFRLNNLFNFKVELTTI